MKTNKLFLFRFKFLWLGSVILVGSCSSLYLAHDLVPKTVDQDPSLPSITLNVGGRSRKIHVRTFGNPSNPKLFIMPGSLSDIRPYLPFQEFADNWFVVMWDQRGQGLSERVSREELSFEMMVEEIRQVKQVYAPSQQIYLLGHSWSANFAGLYTGTYPGDVARVVLMEPFGFKSESMQASQSAVNLWTPGYLDMSWIAHLGPSLNHAQLDFRTLAMLKSRVRDFFMDDENLPEWPVWRVGGYALFTWESALIKNGSWDYDLSKGMENFTGRVLFIGSLFSPIGSDFQQKWHLPLYPIASQASVYVLTNSGHRMITENWTDLKTAIRQFLEAL